MITETNMLDVPEARNYHREEIDGGIVIRFEQRDPGERNWRTVTLFKPDELRMIHQEAMNDWYEDAPPLDEDECPACGEVGCSGACTLP